MTLSDPHFPEDSFPAGDYRAIVFYDGVCGLCNRVVQFLLQRDSDRNLRYAALQSPLGAQALAAAGLEGGDSDLETMLLLERDGTIHQRSRAALRTLRHIRGGYRILGGLAWLPNWLLDPIYRLVSRTRYRLFGRLDTCPLPPKDSAELFVDQPPEAIESPPK